MVEGLKKMWALLPKHKGTDKLQAELKAKMSEAREEAEQEKRSPKKGGVSYKIPKQGAGQYVLLGAPNTGKSQLVVRLTRATPEVAPRSSLPGSPPGSGVNSVLRIWRTIFWVFQGVRAKL